VRQVRTEKVKIRKGSEAEMTNQEAIETIEKNYPPENYSMLRGALDMAIALLKEQETHDTRKSRIFQCEKCGYGIDDIFLNDESNYPITPVYCPNCGRLVKCNE